jgi:hypothetical protein
MNAGSCGMPRFQLVQTIELHLLVTEKLQRLCIV